MRRIAGTGSQALAQQCDTLISVILLKSDICHSKIQLIEERLIFLICRHFLKIAHSILGCTTPAQVAILRHVEACTEGHFVGRMTFDNQLKSSVSRLAIAIELMQLREDIGKASAQQAVVRKCYRIGQVSNSKIVFPFLDSKVGLNRRNFVPNIREGSRILIEIIEQSAGAVVIIPFDQRFRQPE